VTAAASTYLFAGGGTGGHLTPALAVAEQIDRLDPGAKILFLCTERDIDGRFLEPTPYGLLRQPIRPMPKRPWQWPGFYRRWRRSGRLARAVLRDVRPKAVLGLGGFAAAPAVRMAGRRGVPAALLNPDSVPGVANRYLARRVAAIFTQFDLTAGHFPASVRANIRQVGCPIRPSLLGVDPAAARIELGLRPDRGTLAVMGGSQGARTVNEAVLGAVEVLARRADTWQVLHVAGPGKVGAAEETYRAAGVAAVVMEFCDRMGLVYAAADVLIARAGANTIAELTATGTPGVLMPYPFHADQHQRHNAAAMVAAGAAVIVDDADNPAANAERLTAAVAELLADPARLPPMARAAADLGQPNAADAVARWLTEQP